MFLRHVKNVDVIIVGSGFGGSIMARILRRLGRSVVMLEKGRHPRFAIGESSTPLANLLLEELARKYDLPDLATFSKWGTWQAAHPEIACGLKRGFSFYQHEWNRPVDFADRTRQLLVAASPHDRIADTHWYRPDFDAHLAKSAEALGAELRQECRFELKEHEGYWEADGVRAPFLIDATGPRGCLFRHFGFAEASFDSFPKTEAVFAHFKNVRRLNADGPYPADDAALHHIFDGGWFWVLRFNNGITSAGAALTEPLARELRISEGAGGWRRLLERLPTVRAQFENAETVTPFYFQPKVSFRSPRCAGENWAMLPSAAGFVDPLFSTGFVLTLLGIERLAGEFESGAERAHSKTLRDDYESKTFGELDAAARLVASAYSAFSDFPMFVEISRFYFASAIWSETLRRLGKSAPSFLFSAENHPPPIEQIDLAGLADASRRNWFPALASDLFANANKIPATRLEIEAMLQRCGF